MKTLMITLFATLFVGFTFAQQVDNNTEQSSTSGTDKLYEHNGKTIDVKIIKVGEYSIDYTYPNETAQQSISRYAVEKIVYASGRTEDVTKKINVNGKDDWENVVILEDKAAATGLKDMGEIRGKTSGLVGFHTAGSADKKSLKKLKEAAADKGAQFILITRDKDNQFTMQSIKKGEAYSYK